MSDALTQLESNVGLLIDSSGRKRDLITSQGKTITSLEEIIAKDAETIAEYASQLEVTKSELAAAIAGNPDFSTMLAERDARIADLSAESESLKAQVVDNKVIIDSAIAEDQVEDAKIAELLDKVKDSLDDDNIEVAA